MTKCEDCNKDFKKAALKHGDVVDFFSPTGQTVRGKVVMKSSMPNAFVVNTCGKYGRPAIVSADNFKRKIRSVS